MAAPPEVSWIAHPDLVTAAIKLLAGALLAVGSALIGVLLYIWHSHKQYVQGIVEQIESKVDKIATSLEQMAVNFEHRLTAIEATCKVNHKDVP